MEYDTLLLRFELRFNWSKLISLSYDVLTEIKKFPPVLIIFLYLMSSLNKKL